MSQNPTRHPPPEKNATESHPPPPPPLSQQNYGLLKVPRRPSQEAEVLIPRPSILLPHLRDTEKEFFELVGSGKDVNVEKYLPQSVSI